MAVASIWVLFSSSSTIGGQLELGGYFKNFSVAFDYPSYDLLGNEYDRPLSGVVSNTLRINSRWRLGESVLMHGSYAVSGRIEETGTSLFSLFSRQSSDYGYRFKDIDQRLYPSEGDAVDNFAVYQNLDRLQATYKASHFDLIVGRQAIAWGSARTINPTDVVAPYVFNELDTEDRIGVDAIRVRIPLGFMGEIDAGYIAGKDFEWERSAFFTRGKFYADETDFAVVFSGFRGNMMVGIDIARSIGGAGTWLEAAYVKPDLFTDEDADGEGSYFRLSTGMDYSFASGTYFFAEYHYNGAGTTDTDEYLSKLGEIAYNEGNVFQLGEHYLIPGLSYQITPLIVSTIEVLANVTDPSAILAPAVDYNIAENVYVAAGAFVGLGEKPDVAEEGVIAIPTLKLRSEFGSYTDVYYCSVRIYF